MPRSTPLAAFLRGDKAASMWRRQTVLTSSKKSFHWLHLATDHLPTMGALPLESLVCSCLPSTMTFMTPKTANPLDWSFGR